MLLIFGVRTRAKKVGEGDFFCPRCGVDRHYLLQRMRRWFTLFFIPVFPVGTTTGEHVRCDTCGGTFVTAVLATPTSAALAENLRSAMRVAAAAMLRAGVAGDPTARQAAVSAVLSTGAPGYDDAALSGDLAQVDVTQLPAYMAPLGQGLKEQGQETFVNQIAGIGIADGPLTVAESAVLETIGSSLGLSAAHLRGIIASVGVSPAPAPDDAGPG